LFPLPPSLPPSLPASLPSYVCLRRSTAKISETTT
jgi:hypothetical protein